MAGQGAHIDGLDDLNRALARAGPLAQRALYGSVQSELEQVLAASVQEVPVDLGILRGSGVTQVELHGSQVIGTIGYGGAASAYALKQHEHMGYSHPGGGKAKYLEDPFNARKPQMPYHLALGVLQQLRTLERR